MLMQALLNGQFLSAHYSVAVHWVDYSIFHIVYTECCSSLCCFGIFLFSHANGALFIFRQNCKPVISMFLKVSKAWFVKFVSYF